MAWNHFHDLKFKKIIIFLLLKAHLSFSRDKKYIVYLWVD